MPPTTLDRPAALLATTRDPDRQQGQGADAATTKGFGGGGANRGRKRKPGSKRAPALSRADWGPLGKHPDLDAIVARQRLHLPLSGRLSAAQVNQAWKRCAGEHHPDRGGAHDTMQLVNGARDLLLGRSLS
jgi:hypothetical protein